MKINEAVKQAIKNKVLTQKEVAQKMEIPFTTLNTTLRRESMTTDKLLKILNVIGYELVLRPTTGNNKSELTIVVDEITDKKEDDQQ